MNSSTTTGLGMKFHWTDVDGTRWSTDQPFMRQAHKAAEIARRVTEQICGPAPSSAEIRRKVQSGDLSLEDRTRIELFEDVKAIAIEVLLRDISTKQEGQ